jgi:hypothetical protein
MHSLYFRLLPKQLLHNPYLRLDYVQLLHFPSLSFLYIDILENGAARVPVSDKKEKKENMIDLVSNIEQGMCFVRIFIMIILMECIR